MFNLIAGVLSALYGVVNNYAIAIALLTSVVMIIVLPLTLKGTKSMIEMQRIQPLMKQIQQQHKGDRVAMNEAVMALYKEHGVNPVGSCLPLVLQAPVFMILWRVLRGLTKECSATMLANGKCGTGEHIAKLGEFVPSYVSKSSQLYGDLLGKKEMLSFGLDLSKAPFRVIGEDVVRGLPYLALVIIVGVLSYYQNRQIMARNAGTPSSNPQQQMIMNLMPIFFGFISLTFASGLIIYLLVSNLFRVGQNYYITHKFYGANRPTPLAMPVIETKITKATEPTKSAKPTKSVSPKPAGQRPVPPSKRTDNSARGGSSRPSKSPAAESPAPSPAPPSPAARPATRPAARPQVTPPKKKPK